ncbi:MAG: methyltransferase domain-containing protein [Gemmatimonadetes bacterium]|nr:methyltransferase domain-containing protein [Gemmatimonadota bacterium]
MPERWLYVVVRSPSEWEAELLAEGLLAAGANGVEQQPAAVSTWFPPPPDPERFVARLRTELAARTGSDPALAWEWRADADWAREWRRGLGARRVGQRLVVTPTWITPEAGPADVVISIDPQMAFGTGEHATTRGVLRLMESAVRTGGRVLDVGTGSAILAIAAARLGAAAVLAAEHDADALGNAAENVERNGVAGRVRLQHALVDERFLAAHPGEFDLILANVLSGVLKPLLPAFRASLRESGRLILSGSLATEAADVLEAARRARWAPEAEDREEDWWSIRLRPA